MTLGAKILTAAAVLCLLLWGVFLALGAQPLKRTGSLTVIYGEHEDFHGDAAVYQKIRNETLYFVYLPRARPPYRWWAIDLKGMTISLIEAPRSVGSRKYVLRGDPNGAAIGNKDPRGEWYVHVSESGAAFSGNGFMCSVRKSKDN